MIAYIKKLLGLGPSVDYKQLLNEGAKVIDVRSVQEFKSGHLKNSINIPLDTIKSKLHKFDKSKPIILICASGMRSGAAKGILKSSGFSEVYNGGGWASFERKSS